MEAGISTGNERYRCFKCVLQNYAKIYAARHFMEQLPQLEELGHEVDEERELFARVVAEEVLQIPVLLRQLWSSLEKMEFFNEDTAFKAYLEARRHPQARILCELTALSAPPFSWTLPSTSSPTSCATATSASTRKSR